MVREAAPQSIWTAAFIAGEADQPARRWMREPVDQKTQALRSTAMPGQDHSGPLAGLEAGRLTRMMTPRKPRTSPATVEGAGRLCQGGSHSRTTNQSGVVARMRAVRPEATLCSDQLTSPLPPKSRRVPTRAPVRHCCLVGQG